MLETIRKEAVRAYKYGWSLIPLRENDKRPNLPVGHEFLSRRPTSDEYKSFKFGNYGIVCGPLSGICVLDIDGPDAEETLDRLDLYVDDLLAPEVKTRRGRHLYFKYSPDVHTGSNVVGKGIDVRSLGSYVVGPGSVVDGKEYQWTRTIEEASDGLTEAPQWLRRGKSDIINDDAQWKMTEKLKSGERNVKMTSLAGSLVSREVPFEIVTLVLRTVNRAWCDEPMDDDELIRIAKSIERKRGK